MKLSKLLVIAVLVGTVGVFGCDDDGGTGGTGGTGGGAADPCTGGFCVDPSEAKAACERVLEFCKSDACCEAKDPTDQECNAIMPKLCMLDFGGAGGAGGAGGTGGGDNPTADEVCANCDSSDAGAIQACKTTYEACLDDPPSGGDPGEKCAVIGLGQCYLVKLVDFQNAAVVVGQADFSGTDANQGNLDPAANTLDEPYGNPAVDDGLLFVGDYGNNRVLAFDPLPTVNNADADFVLGQPDFTTTTANTTQSGMDWPQSVATVDGKMVVADYGNHRVLIYNSIPTDGAEPDVVVGQPDFDTDTPDCDANSLAFPETATVTPGGKLIVTDSDNNRVLIWNALPTANGQPADMVLGQGDFTHCAENDDDQNGAPDGDPSVPTAHTLFYPAGVWADDTRLVVADSENHRVLIWTAFPTANFQPADLVLGQDDFTTRTAATTQSGMNTPYDGVHSNGVQLVVTDWANHRTLIWNSFPTMSFQPADTVLGQSNFTNNTENDDNQDGTPDTNASARTQNNPTGALFYEDKLLVVDNDNNRLLIYQSQ
jgi:hypothetical protein